MVDQIWIGPYYKNKMYDLLKWPKLRQEMNYYIPRSSIFVELKDRPNTKEKHERELALVVVILQ